MKKFSTDFKLFLADIKLHHWQHQKEVQNSSIIEGTVVDERMLFGLHFPFFLRICTLESIRCIFRIDENDMKANLRITATFIEQQRIRSSINYTRPSCIRNYMQGGCIFRCDSTIGNVEFDFWEIAQKSIHSIVGGVSSTFIQKI